MSDTTEPAASDRTRSSAFEDDGLTPCERRCVALMALGLTDAQIGRRLGSGFVQLNADRVRKEIKSACAKKGMGPRRLMLWLLDDLAPEQRAVQVAAAERRREQLRASGMLTPQRVEVAMVYAHPDNCDFPQGAIGALVTPRVSPALVGRYLREMYKNIGPNGSLNKLIAVLHLAPLSMRTTTEEDVPPPETL